MSGKVKVSRAGRAYECRAQYWDTNLPGVGIIDRWRAGRPFDGGPVPADHTASIAPGTLYVQWQRYGETQRMCEACGRAAGLIGDPT